MDEQRCGGCNKPNDSMNLAWMGLTFCDHKCADKWQEKIPFVVSLRAENAELREARDELNKCLKVQREEIEDSHADLAQGAALIEKFAEDFEADFVERHILLVREAKKAWPELVKHYSAFRTFIKQQAAGR